MTFGLFSQSNQSQTLYTTALQTAWRSGVQLYDPDVWLHREPELEEAMLRDADIAQAVTLRRHLIAGRDWSLVPKNDAAPGADVATAVGTELLGAIRKFSGARFNLARAFFSGSRFAFVHGSLRTLTIGDGTPRKWWVPSRIEDRDKRRYRFVPFHEDDEKLGGQWEIFNVATGTWDVVSERERRQTIRHVYQDDEGTLGHGRGLREALGWWWYAKTNTLQETLQAVERYGQGILTAKIGGLREAGTNRPNATLVAEWQAVLEDLRSRHVIVYDENDSIEVIHPQGTGWQLLNEVRQELRTTVTTLILGANLTTSASEGGSYALARVQENSTEALVQFDREQLEETLTDDLLGCVWSWNYPNLLELGIADEMPRFTIKQEKVQDPEVRARVATMVSRDLGVSVSVDDVREQTGFRKPDPGEEIVTPPQQAAPDPFGGGLPFKR